MLLAIIPFDAAPATPGDGTMIARVDISEKRAEALMKSNPSRAAPLIWQGIVLSTRARAKQR